MRKTIQPAILTPDGTSIERTYSDRGQPHLLEHAGTTIDTRTYDNGGRMTGSSYNNGGSETRAYNTDNTLSSIRYSSAAIRNMSYSWANIQTTPNKNETGETITGTMSGYGFSIPTSGYDGEDRLVTYNRTDGNLDQSWSLSSVGDWNSITSRVGANPPQTQSRAHGQSHELLSAAGQSVTHDTKGNITLIPNSLRPTPLALTWDFDNRMSSADVDNDSTADVTYQFDALGRRVARTADATTTVYVQTGQQTIADYPSGAVSSAPTYRYVYGSYIDEPVLRYQPAGAQSAYYHRNQQYSVTALTNSSGGILERYAYSAYGTPTITNASGTVLTSSAHNNRYTYTGREWDETISLYHYRARMYDPELGRFCSKDPIGFEGSMWNLFEYAMGQSVSVVDPSGTLSISPFVPPPGTYPPGSFPLCGRSMQRNYLDPMDKNPVSGKFEPDFRQVIGSLSANASIGASGSPARCGKNVYLDVDLTATMNNGTWQPLTDFTAHSTSSSDCTFTGSTTAKSAMGLWRCPIACSSDRCEEAGMLALFYIGRTNYVETRPGQIIGIQVKAKLDSDCCTPQGCEIKMRLCQLRVGVPNDLNGPARPTPLPPSFAPPLMSTCRDGWNEGDTQTIK